MGEKKNVEEERREKKSSGILHNVAIESPFVSQPLLEQIIQFLYFRLPIGEREKKIIQLRRLNTYKIHCHLGHRENAQKLGAVIDTGRLRRKQSVKFLVALPWGKPVRSGMRSHFIVPSAGLETKWKSQQEDDSAALSLSHWFSGRLPHHAVRNSCVSPLPAPPNLVTGAFLVYLQLPARLSSRLFQS